MCMWSHLEQGGMAWSVVARRVVSHYQIYSTLAIIEEKYGHYFNHFTVLIKSRFCPLKPNLIA